VTAESNKEPEESNEELEELNEELKSRVDDSGSRCPASFSCASLQSAQALPSSFKQALLSSFKEVNDSKQNMSVCKASLVSVQTAALFFSN
jgi:hypothetical protein